MFPKPAVTRNSLLTYIFRSFLRLQHQRQHNQWAFLKPAVSNNNYV